MVFVLFRTRVRVRPTLARNVRFSRIFTCKNVRRDTPLSCRRFQKSLAIRYRRSRRGSAFCPGPSRSHTINVCRRTEIRCTMSIRFPGEVVFLFRFPAAFLSLRQRLGHRLWAFGRDTTGKRRPIFRVCAPTPKKRFRRRSLRLLLLFPPPPGVLAIDLVYHPYTTTSPCPDRSHTPHPVVARTHVPATTNHPPTFSPRLVWSTSSEQYASRRILFEFFDNCRLARVSWIR